MKVIDKPASFPKSADDSASKAINLFELGCLFVLRVSYWTCRSGNEPDELNLTPDRIERRAIASFGTKDLIDPEIGRKRFSQIEKKARHELAKFSQPFPAANAHFVPWAHVPALVKKLATIQAEYQTAVKEFLAEYPKLRTGWQAEHPDVPNAAYPPAIEIEQKFNFIWHSFKVAGADSVAAIDDLESELESRTARAVQLEQMKASLQSECQRFVADYVKAFRSEVAGFCDQVVEAGGKVHGKTLQAIRRKIDHFHAMNIFGDGQTAAQLDQLKAQIAGLTGEDLAEQPQLAKKLSQACSALRAEVVDAAGVSALTGRLKRRVVLQ